MRASLAKLSINKISARQGVIPLAFLVMLPSAISITLDDLGYSPSGSPLAPLVSLLSFALIICAITGLPRILASSSSSKIFDIILSTLSKKSLLAALIYTVAISIFNILALQIQSFLVGAATHPIVNILPQLWMEENTRLKFIVIFLSILCFLPVIILIARTFLVPLLITDPGFNLRRAIGRSKVLTRKQTFNIVFTLLVPLLVLSLSINTIIRALPEALDVSAARLGVLVLGVFLRSTFGALTLAYWAAVMVALYEIRTTRSRPRTSRP